MSGEYFCINNNGTIFIKEAQFFRDQGGLKEPWGKNWKHIYADSIEHARTKVELLILKGQWP